MRLIGRIVWGHEIRRRHVVLALAGALVLALVVAWETLPDAGLRWALARGLRAMGMVEVSVADTDISLFGGRLTVRKVVARPPLGTALGIRDFALRFRWAPLLNKRLVLDRVAVEGIDIDLKRDEGGGFVLNGLPLAVAATPPAPPLQAGTPPPPQEWGLDVASLELTNSRLHLSDGEFLAEIAVERLVVENLHSLNSAIPVSFRLTGSLNGAPVMLTGTLRPFAAEPAFALEAELRHVALADFAALAGRNGIGDLQGQADVTLAVEGRLAEAGAVVKGSLRLEAEHLGMTAPVALKASRLVLDVRRLDWDGAKADLAAGLDLTDVAATAPGGGGSAARLALEVGRAEWDGRRLALTAKIDGTTLAGKGEGGEGAAAALGLEAKSLSWEGGKLSWQGGLTLAGGHVAVAGSDASPDSVTWAGRLDLDTAPLSGRAEGKLEVGAQRLALADILVTHKRAGAEGWVEFGKATALQVRLNADAVTVRDTAKGVDWTALDHVDATDLALAPDGGVHVGRLGVDGLAVLRKDGKGGFPWRVEARRLRLDQAGRDGDGDVSVAEARLDGLIARVTRTRDGLLGLDKPAGDRKPGPAKAAGEEPDYALGKLILADSRVIFEDRTMPEPVRLEVRPFDLTVSNMDSETPERDSPFEAKAGIGRSMVTLSGVARPFAAELTGRLDGQIKAFELPPLSPYLAETMGVQLQSGHFDGTLAVGAKGGALSGALDVSLSNLFIAPPDPNAPLVKKAEMPIETVLDLLRDGDDRIHLSLPIRGNAANPDLDISDAVSQAVAGALKSTMLTTLKLAFPVAALIEMAVDANDNSRLALAPLAFAPGADTLSDEHRKTLGAVADLMKGRPGLRLTLCGKADSADWPVVAARKRAEDKPLLSRLERMVGLEKKAEDLGPPDRDLLGTLAEHRANAARDYLADQGGIDNGRLFGCRPSVEAADKGARVELLL